MDSVMLAMNIKVVSGCHSRVTFTNASYKMGMVSPDAICRIYGWVISPSDLVVNIGTLLSMVTRHDLSLTCPSAFRLLLPLLADTLSV
jgi:hypothetical protein